MPGGGGKQVPLSYFWGVIRQSVMSKATTGALWNAVKFAAGQQGLSLAPGAFAQMNKLRGLATTQRRAKEALAGAAAESGFEASMIAQDIDSGPLDQQGAVPIYRVAFEHQLTGPEGDFSEWRTSYFYGQLPATVGELRAQLEAEGLDLIGEYHGGEGVSHVGIGEIVVTRV